ncbi:MAG: alpha/beta fold hydrolase [Bacillus sp. (in: firmicutes)]
MKSACNNIVIYEKEQIGRVNVVLHYRTYRLEEYKPWVTFIHGAGGSSAIWYKQVKEYRKHFNVLLIDLRGHGKSQQIEWQKGDTFKEISDEVVAVLDKEDIGQSHFVGMSLGTVVIQSIAQRHSHRIESMLLGGAVTKLNARTKFFLFWGHALKHVLPFMWIYRLFAWIMMPRRNHCKARNMFVKQAKKMNQQEFLRWFELTKKVNPYLRKLQKQFFNIPTLFVMGEEDYLFLEAVEDTVLNCKESLGIECIEGAGHVCNIDQPETFNRIGIEFIYKNSEVIFPMKIS